MFKKILKFLPIKSNLKLSQIIETIFIKERPMRNFFVNMFSFTGENAAIQIDLFDIWHILYFVILLGAAIGGGYAIIRSKSDRAKEITLKVLAYLVPAVYIADFIIMPLSEGSINTDKLPFHICTIMGFMIPFAQFNKKFEPIKGTIACLSTVASLMYITYPGSALGGLSPWCYRIIQTFVYHGVVLAWGVISIMTDEVELDFHGIWKELAGIAMIILWAGFGNVVYSSPEHHFDWFFVTGSTFPFVPKWLMPYVVLTAVFGMCAIIYGINYGVRKLIAKRQSKKDIIG